MKALLGSLDGGRPPAPPPRRRRGRPPKHPDLTTVARIVASEPAFVWLLFELPYSRPSAVRAALGGKAEVLERMGLLEREPTATVAIYRCTERGEDVAQQLLASYGRRRT